MTAAELALGAFTLCNSVRVLAYVPQIALIHRDRTGAAAVSYSTWGLFSASHLSTVAYAALALEDPKMALVFMANTACCAAILGLTFFKRRRYRKDQAPTAVVSAAMIADNAASTPVPARLSSFKPRLIVNPAYRRERLPVPLMEEWLRQKVC
jgi:hypothetical protein